MELIQGTCVKFELSVEHSEYYRHLNCFLIQSDVYSRLFLLTAASLGWPADRCKIDVRGSDLHDQGVFSLEVYF